MDFNDFDSFGSSPSNDFDFNQSSGMGDVSGFSDFGGSPSAPTKPGRSGWYWPLTVLALLLATAASVGVALGAAGHARGALMMGLTFAAPSAAVLLAALLLENLASPMNPRYSRKAQVVTALLATLATFVIGCFGELSASAVVMTGNTSTNYIIVMDKSGSMWGASNEESVGAVEQLLAQIPADAEVGLVTFEGYVLGTTPMAPMTQGQLEALTIELRREPSGGTNFYSALQAALNLITDTQRPTKVLLITDGEDASLSYGTNDQLIVSQAASCNASISCVKISGMIYSDLLAVIDATGGSAVLVSDASQLLAGITQLGLLDNGATDILQADLRDTGKTVTAAVLFVLTGLTLGLALSLMLSRQGQKRFQLLLSPLMGALAFAVCVLLPQDSGVLSNPIAREGISFALYGVVLMRSNA